MKAIKTITCIHLVLSVLFLVWLASYFSPGIVSLILVGPRDDDISSFTMTWLWIVDIVYWLIYITSLSFIVHLFFGIFKGKDSAQLNRLIQVNQKSNFILLAVSIIVTICLCIACQSSFATIMFLSSIVPTISCILCFFVKHKLLGEEKEGVI